MEKSLIDTLSNAQAENALLRKLLEDAIGLLGDFANSYISEDGKTVIETRGGMGRRLGVLWPKALAMLALDRNYP